LKNLGNPSGNPFLSLSSKEEGEIAISEKSNILSTMEIVFYLGK
jgi:hypothetical protein